MLRKFCLKTIMMESNSFLFNKPLLMVLIMDKYFQCATRLIFKSNWCCSSDFKHTKSATGHTLRIFVKSTCIGECKFLCEKKLYNRTIGDTYFGILKSGTFFLKCIFMLFFFNLESRILHPES